MKRYPEYQRAMADDSELVLTPQVLRKIYKRYLHKACTSKVFEGQQNENGEEILRSSIKTSSDKPRNQAILPPVCIVCNQQKGYFTELVSTCICILKSSVSCASLIPRLYLDSNTLEVKYHNRCYERYTAHHL